MFRDYKLTFRSNTKINVLDIENIRNENNNVDFSQYKIYENLQDCIDEKLDADEVIGKPLEFYLLRLTSL